MFYQKRFESKMSEHGFEQDDFKVNQETGEYENTNLQAMYAGFVIGIEDVNSKPCSRDRNNLAK